MAELEIHDAPAPVVAKPKVGEVTDSLGRLIKFRRIKPAARMDMLGMLGPERAAVKEVLGYATLGYCVTEIDGERRPPAMAYEHLQATVDLLDDEGLEAVGTAYAAAFGVKPITDADKDAVKN